MYTGAQKTKKETVVVLVIEALFQLLYVVLSRIVFLAHFLGAPLEHLAQGRIRDDLGLLDFHRAVRVDGKIVPHLERDGLGTGERRASKKKYCARQCKKQDNAFHVFTSTASRS
jgi:hypothetical protein